MHIILHIILLMSVSIVKMKFETFNPGDLLVSNCGICLAGERLYDSLVGVFLCLTECVHGDEIVNDAMTTFRAGAVQVVGSNMRRVAEMCEVDDVKAGS